MKSNYIIKNLDLLFPNAKCELEYNKDYELLIAVLLSAQSTDKRVNIVTKELFKKYDIYSLSKAKKEDIERIIYPVGTHKKKSEFIIKIANSLVNDYNGIVPNNRDYLEKLPGIGRKTCNVVLSELYNVPSIAVDTHVKRVTNRLGIVNSSDVLEIEKELEKKFSKKDWIKLHHELVLFGRYICKSTKPLCDKCPFKCNDYKSS